jgi:hypothetical protein
VIPHCSGQVRQYLHAKEIAQWKVREIENYNNKAYGAVDEVTKEPSLLSLIATLFKLCVELKLRILRAFRHLLSISLDKRRSHAWLGNGQSCYL